MWAQRERETALALGVAELARALWPCIDVIHRTAVPPGPAVLGVPVRGVRVLSPSSVAQGRIWGLLRAQSEFDMNFRECRGAAEVKMYFVGIDRVGTL